MKDQFFYSILRIIRFKRVFEANVAVFEIKVRNSLCQKFSSEQNFEKYINLRKISKLMIEPDLARI